METGTRARFVYAGVGELPCHQRQGEWQAMGLEVVTEEDEEVSNSHAGGGG